jgi:predicted nucleic-acid-binding protein
VILGLDTSVVMRLLTEQPEEQARAALRYLWQRFDAGDRVLVSDAVVAEAYFALQHYYGDSKGQALEQLRRLLATPGIECAGEAGEVLRLEGLESAKPGFLDRVIHQQYLRAGAEEVATFERSATKLPMARVLGR